ncbi:MAG: SPOR domain-containing protein [Bacteroidales bacterium]|jgi:hypothetical protein|nr:SPOR domain-containing protein [Bacteroidales bacterium]
MNRILIPIVTGILLVFLAVFFLQKGVKIELEMPDVIQAGSEITVNVVIDKGNLSSFARFQQDVPYGFTVKAINSANADFSFQEQKVTMIWLSLPEDEKFVASYALIANERLSGRIDLSGRFSYIEDNERKSIDLIAKSLSVTPSPNIDPAMVVDVRDFAKMQAPATSATRVAHVACLREHPLWLPESNSFLITLLINKDNVDKMAKLEEKIPEGYTASNIDSKSGIFSFDENAVKILWSVLPSDPYFVIKYKITPDDGVTVNPSEMNISGMFSYLDNDKTMTAGVIEQSGSLEGLAREAVNEIIRKEVTPVTAASTQVAGRDAAVPADNAPVQVAVSPPVPVSSAAPAASGRQVEATQAVVQPENAVIDGSGAAALPETGVYYRVQIAAGHRPVNARRYFGKYQLEHDVVREEHEGWYKYSVGTFPEYRTARDYRVYLRSNTQLDGAFVTAYNNGTRITVQEALMALNQKWVR